MPETERHFTVEQLKNALNKQDDAFVIETTRRQANTFVKHGDPYIAELLRDLCDRLEEGIVIRQLGGWKETEKELPEEGRAVAVPNNNGTRLFRSGNLWKIEDSGDHIYYTPTYWRYL